MKIETTTFGEEYHSISVKQDEMLGLGYERSRLTSLALFSLYCNASLCVKMLFRPSIKVNSIWGQLAQNVPTFPATLHHFCIFEPWFGHCYVLCVG